MEKIEPDSKLIKGATNLKSEVVPNDQKKLILEDVPQ